MDIAIRIVCAVHAVTAGAIPVVIIDGSGREIVAVCGSILRGTKCGSRPFNGKVQFRVAGWTEGLDGCAQHDTGCSAGESIRFALTLVALALVTLTLMSLALVPLALVPLTLVPLTLMSLTLVSHPLCSSMVFFLRLIL
jgi:hypothetical protein